MQPKRNDIIYILTTGYERTLLVGYTDHKTNKSLPEITSADRFKFCYLRYVYDGKEIYEYVKRDRDLRYYDRNVVEYDAYLTVCNSCSCKKLKDILDRVVNSNDIMAPPPSYDQAMSVETAARQQQ